MRYRVTHEFELDDPADYQLVMNRIHGMFKNLEDRTPGYCPDYTQFEKVKRHVNHKRQPNTRL